MYKRLKDLRKDHDKSQEYIAKNVIYTQTTVYRRYEAGSREIPLNIAILLAKYYEVSLDYIAGLTDTPTAIGGGKYKIIKEHE